MYDIVNDSKSVRTEHFDSLGKYLPLSLFHDPSLKHLGRVAFFYSDCLLCNYRSAVAHLVYEMHCRARELHSLPECRLVNVESVKALAAKAWYERGMYVYHAIFKRACELAVKDYHKACEHNKVDASCLECVDELSRVLYSIGMILLRDNDTLDAVILRALERVRALLRGHDHFNFAAFDDAAIARIEYRLKVGAAARHQNCNFLHLCHRYASSD